MSHRRQLRTKPIVRLNYSTTLRWLRPTVLLLGPCGGSLLEWRLCFV